MDSRRTKNDSDKKSRRSSTPEPYKRNLSYDPYDLNRPRGRSPSPLLSPFANTIYSLKDSKGRNPEWVYKFFPPQGWKVPLCDLPQGFTPLELEKWYMKMSPKTRKKHRSPGAGFRDPKVWCCYQLPGEGPCEFHAEFLREIGRDIGGPEVVIPKRSPVREDRDYSSDENYERSQVEGHEADRYHERHNREYQRQRDGYRADREQGEHEHYHQRVGRRTERERETREHHYQIEGHRTDRERERGNNEQRQREDHRTNRDRDDRDHQRRREVYRGEDQGSTRLRESRRARELELTPKRSQECSHHTDNQSPGGPNLGSSKGGRSPSRDRHRESTRRSERESSPVSKLRRRLYEF